MRSTLLTIQILLICFALVSAKEPKAGDRPTNVVRCAESFWKPDSQVDVYFMRDLFTAAQRQAAMDTMNNPQESARRIGLAITFTYAGDTDGLIDCENCLTVVRPGNAHHRKRQTIINSLRRSGDGNLLSAWIEIDQETLRFARLREFMFAAPRGVRGSKESSTCLR